MRKPVTAPELLTPPARNNHQYIVAAGKETLATIDTRTVDDVTKDRIGHLIGKAFEAMEPQIVAFIKQQLASQLTQVIRPAIAQALDAYVADFIVHNEERIVKGIEDVMTKCWDELVEKPAHAQLTKALEEVRRKMVGGGG